MVVNMWPTVVDEFEWDKLPTKVGIRCHEELVCHSLWGVIYDLAALKGLRVLGMLIEI